MIPARYSHLLFGLILSGLMSFIVSGIATFRSIGPAPDFLSLWMGAWLPSWAVAFPSVLIAASVARRLVARLVRAED